MDSVEWWAVEQFGMVELGDKRRTQRAVEMAQGMARRPADGIANQMGDWNGQRGAYRLLDNEEASHPALSEPHCHQPPVKAAYHGQSVLRRQHTTTPTLHTH